MSCLELLRLFWTMAPALSGLKSVMGRRWIKENLQPPAFSQSKVLTGRREALRQRTRWFSSCQTRALRPMSPHGNVYKSAQCPEETNFLAPILRGCLCSVGWNVFAVLQTAHRITHCAQVRPLPLEKCPDSQFNDWLAFRLAV